MEQRVPVELLSFTLKRMLLLLSKLLSSLGKSLFYRGGDEEMNFNLS